MTKNSDKYWAGRLSEIKNTFRSLRYKNYRLFFYGQSISLIGTWIQRITTPWLVYELTGSAFMLGVVSFADQIPSLLLSPLAGVLTDRWNRYHLLIITQVAAMAQALVMAFLFLSGTIEVWHIILLSIFHGCVKAFDVTARQAFLIEMVEKKEDLPNAIALNSTMMNGAKLLGPSIAGLLIVLAGEGICFLINGLSYIFVVASLLLMTIVPRKITNQSKQVIKNLKEGFAYTFGFGPIKSIILLRALVGLMGMPYSVLMPVFAIEILHGDSHTFGFLMGASGLGAMMGAIYLASRKSVLGLAKLIPRATILFGVALIAFSLSRFFLLSLVLMVAVGLGLMLQMASSSTIIQTVVEDDKRGRVMSFYTMAHMGTTPFGSFLAGALASSLGVAHTLLLGGLACIAGAYLFARKLPEIKKSIRPIYIKLGIVSEGPLEIQAMTTVTVPPEK